MVQVEREPKQDEQIGHLHAAQVQVGGGPHVAVAPDQQHGHQVVAHTQGEQAEVHRGHWHRRPQGECQAAAALITGLQRAPQRSPPPPPPRPGTVADISGHGCGLPKRKCAWTDGAFVALTTMPGPPEDSEMRVASASARGQPPSSSLDTVSQSLGFVGRSLATLTASQEP